MIFNPLLEELKKLIESSKYAVAQGTYSNLNDKKKKYLILKGRLGALKFIRLNFSAISVNQKIIDDLEIEAKNLKYNL
jgi:50S ribosomal subunit-associated GTPase HflX